MHIGIDGRVLTLRPTGLFNYTYNLLVRMMKHGGHRWTIFAPAPLTASLAASTTASKGLTIRTYNISNSKLHLPWQQSLLPLMMSGEALDVFWSPHHFLPPFHQTIPMVCTIVDLIWAGYPQDMRPLRIMIEKHLMERAVSKAAAITAISSATEMELYARFPKARDKTTVIPAGVVALPECSDNTPPIAFPYVLFVGSVQRRKNLKRLIQAFALLPEDLRTTHRLVIAGSHAWGADFHDEIYARKLTNQVIVTGYVDRERLSCLYKHATVFAIPSLVEGFGLPILEAMSSGVPVLTSNRSSMAEVAGNAALLIDPYDITDISRGLETLLRDKELRHTLILRGYERTLHYSWDQSSALLLEILEKAASGR